MSEYQSQGGFVGDLAAALTVTDADGCCGNPAQAASVGSAEAADTTAASCCGTAAEAAGSCCGTAAKAEAIASGQGCCG